jgi:hypothetical protein
MNPEQSQAFDAVLTEQNQSIVYMGEKIANLKTANELNVAQSRLIDARCKLRVTLRRCAVAVVTLTVCWSVFLFTIIR